MKINFNQFIVPHFWKKFIIMLSAIILMGFFLSFLIEAEFGADPCSFMNINISSTIGWSLGNWQLTLNAVLFLITLIFNRKLIGFGTIANWILIGYTADFCCWLWNISGLHNLIHNPSFLALRIVIFILAIFCFIIVAAIYMNAQMGLSPYDALPVIVSKYLSRVPYSIIRIIYDFMAIGIGFAASIFNSLGRQGSLIGTMIIALTLGPTISFVGNFMKKNIFKEN